MYLLNTLIVIASFIGMEAIAWGLHKFVMHGFMWSMHKDHHIPGNKKFQHNDFFALVFGIPSWLLMMYGIMAGNDFRLYMGIGITLYGICYVLVHDGLIHQRFSFLPKTSNRYLIALKKGHWAHHMYDGSKDYNKDNDISYGMLWVPWQFFKDAILRKKL